MKKSNILADILLGIKDLYMKESKTLADIVVISQPLMKLMLSIKGLCMNELSTIADYVIIRQLQWEILLGIKVLYMKESNTLAEIVVISQHLRKHKRAVHEGVKYPCRQCGYQATSNGHLAWHKRRSQIPLQIFWLVNI